MIYCFGVKIRKIFFQTVIVCDDEEFPATDKCDPIVPIVYIEFIVIEDSVPTGTLFQFDFERNTHTSQLKTTKYTISDNVRTNKVWSVCECVSLFDSFHITLQ